MGDAGEGLIDAEARIQERMEEMRLERASAQKNSRKPEGMQKLESLTLARTELARQLNAATHQSRKDQLRHALAEIDNGIAEAQAAINGAALSALPGR